MVLGRWFGVALVANLIPLPVYAADPEGPPQPVEAVQDAAEGLPVAYPNIQVEGTVDLQSDRIRPVADPSARISSVFATIEPEVTVNLSEQFRLFGHFIYEPVLDPLPGDTQYFRDEGFYVEELFAQATLGDAEVSIGKVDPVFGLAVDDAPGIYGAEFADAYSFVGGLGAGVDWQIATQPTSGFDGAAASLEQTLSAYAFSADASFLSRSLFIDRGQLSRADGGLGNTDLPESFALAYQIRTVDAEDALAGPSGQLAVRRLAAGQDGAHDEWGFVASGEDIFALGDDVTLTALAEIAYFVHEGGDDADAATLTLGAELQRGPWLASLTAAAHDAFDNSGSADLLLTCSVGREFEFESTGAFRVDLAYARSRTDGEDANTLGLRFRKEFSWSSGAGPD